ncbi:hypothetical protein FPANT_13892 [Fusarium pseudoanthophilum]|uniref:Uncharacterized protein n=1 Tax=Fusarium pseudoanthophilum TaxID=48495 RepID=A0A8H5NKA8_9HYPO|nr:hypothetical protein FPANT_13892 [Fusarium pseudoanthophilum]
MVPETAIGSLETVLGKIAENIHMSTPKPAAKTNPAVEAKSGGMIAVVDHEPQLKYTPLLFQTCHILRSVYLKRHLAIYTTSPPASRSYGHVTGPSSVERHCGPIGAVIDLNYKAMHHWFMAPEVHVPRAWETMRLRMMGRIAQQVLIPLHAPDPSSNGIIVIFPHSYKLPVRLMSWTLENLLTLTNLVNQERKLRLDLIIKRIHGHTVSS